MSAPVIAHLIAHPRGDTPVVDGGDRDALCGVTYQPRDLDPGLPVCCRCVAALIGEHAKLATGLLRFADAAQTLIAEWERRDREGCGSDAKFGACAYELSVALGLEDTASSDKETNR